VQSVHKVISNAYINTRSSFFVLKENVSENQVRIKKKSMYLCI